MSNTFRIETAINKDGKIPEQNATYRNGKSHTIAEDKPVFCSVSVTLRDKCRRKDAQKASKIKTNMQCSDEKVQSITK